MMSDLKANSMYWYNSLMFMFIVLYKVIISGRKTISVLALLVSKLDSCDHSIRRVDILSSITLSNLNFLSDAKQIVLQTSPTNKMKSTIFKYRRRNQSHTN